MGKYIRYICWSTTRMRLQFRKFFFYDTFTLPIFLSILKLLDFLSQLLGSIKVERENFSKKRFFFYWFLLAILPKFLFLKFIKEKKKSYWEKGLFEHNTRAEENSFICEWPFVSLRLSLFHAWKTPKVKRKWYFSLGQGLKGDLASKIKIYRIFQHTF